MSKHKILHNGPTSGLIKYWFAYLWMKMTGWKIVADIPPDKKFIIVGAPHTSNWDFPLALLTCFALRLKIAWIGKHSLFKKPFGGFMRRLGGIPVNRECSSGIVEQMAKKFANSEKLVVAIAASGTRKKSDYWRSGFYWIAHEARVPILCGYLDYTHKEAGFGLTFLPSGDIQKDMARIREFYRNVTGKFPEKTTPVRVRDETGNKK